MTYVTGRKIAFVFIASIPGSIAINAIPKKYILANFFN